MAIYSDMNGFPESGMPVLKDAKGTAKADSLVVTDAISIVAGDANNLASIGKSNTFTNGAVGSTAFMAGYNNTINLTGTAARGVAIGHNCTATLATGQSRSMALGFDCAANGSSSITIGLNNSGEGISFGRNNISGVSGIGVGSGNSGTGVGVGASNNVSGADSTGIGASNTVSGNFNQATGYQNTCTATGNYNVAIGAFSQSTGTGIFTTSMGIGCQANASNGMGMGFGAISGTGNAGIFGYAPNAFAVTNSTANSCMFAYEGTNILMDANRITANKPVRLPRYTVATLPTGQAGDIAYCTDLTAPTYDGVLVGGGAIGRIVAHNGTAWKS